MRSAISLIALACLAACGDRAANAASASAASAATDSAGSIEGDVYLVMQSGDTKRGAGRTVFLVPATDSLAASTAAACENYGAKLNASVHHLTAIRDSMVAIPWVSDLLKRHADEVNARIAADGERTVSTVDSLLIAGMVDSTGTGAGAHYRFPRVPPGRYLLASDWRIAANNYRWAVAVTVKPGEAVHRDLDNSAEATDRLYCSIPHTE